MATKLLAFFALGGSSGVRLQDVADALHKPILEISSALAKLAASGVIVERPRDPSQSGPPINGGARTDARAAGETCFLRRSGFLAYR